MQEIAAISPVHNLGALSLDSQPLKHSLRAEATNWKVHFSKNIHKQAAADLQVQRGAPARLGPDAGQCAYCRGAPGVPPALLAHVPTHPAHGPCPSPTAPPHQAFDAYLRELTAKLGRRIEDLDDVKALVAALREVGRASVWALPQQGGGRGQAAAGARDGARQSRVVGGACHPCSAPHCPAARARPPAPQVREYEANVDAVVGPIEDIYALLMR